MFGIHNGKLIDRFEGLPEQKLLADFFKALLDASSGVVGPVAIAAEEYDGLMQVRRRMYRMLWPL